MLAKPLFDSVLLTGYTLERNEVTPGGGGGGGNVDSLDNFLFSEISIKPTYVSVVQLGASRAVGGDAGCRAYPISGAWLGFPAQANQPPISSGSVLVPDLFWKDTTLISLLVGHWNHYLDQICTQSNCLHDAL